MKLRKLLLAAALPAIATLSAGAAALAAPAPLAFEADGMTRVLAAKAGRPFVMLVWSLDCSYCHASMKNLAAAQPGLDIVTVAIEPASDQATTDAIAAATSALGPRTSRWAFGSAPAEQLRYKIDPKWHGELPRSYWYNAQGQRVAAISGLITPKLISETATKMGIPQ
ncbi:TlpA family protein disulfide reductase [Pseudoduganella sp. FT55W]|uniref:TlpA family protein disulfide reductase n=1 Tax=Duganella rivi TaxID=2666083 RepID=A0A7X4GQF1_9BURK|nr:TlpA family protein disulfide reductase [Duganella rivi]MYM67324.1 TlpA family protein disulfide reductase [Duganella rivi]